MLIIDDAVIITLGGASIDTWGDRDAEPTWVHSSVLFSQTASNSGYQYLVWMLGICNASGFSENVTAWQPLSASLLTSLAASTTSYSGRMPHGMNRPGYAPHHSSTCQSL